MVAGQAHGLHHSLGARHVKGHLVHARDLLQACRIAGHAGVVHAERGPQALCLGEAFGHGFFVKVCAKHVHAIRAGEVIKRLAIQVGHVHASSRLQERTHFQVLLHQGAELKGHTVSRNELHVGDVFTGRCAGLNAQGVTGFEDLGNFEKCLAAKVLYLERRVVTFKEHLLVKMVAR